MMKTGYCILHCIALILVVIGAVNWGLIGAFDYNLVEEILGNWPVVVQIVYIAVGVSGILMLLTLTPMCKACKMNK